MANVNTHITPNMTSTLWSPNLSELLGIFQELATLSDELGEGYRAKAFRDAATKIQNYGSNIFTDYTKVKIHKVGPSSKKIIKDYLTYRGQVPRLAELREKAQQVRAEIVQLEADFKAQENQGTDLAIVPNSKAAVIHMFRGVYGVGQIKAEEWYNAGLRTLDEAWDYATAAQQLGIMWYEHLQERIPRDEADMIVDFIDQVFVQLDPNLIWMACGSYRRGKADMGDLDILIQRPPTLTLKDFRDTLEETGLLVGHLGMGKVKYFGICRLGEEYNAHRLDLMIVDKNVWPYATLYFTGSQNLNVAMRDRAIELGLTLNEYRLTNSQTGYNYPAETEVDIFEHLGMSYLEPTERNI